MQHTLRVSSVYYISSSSGLQKLWQRSWEYLHAHLRSVCLMFKIVSFLSLIDSSRRRKGDLQAAAADGHRKTVLCSQAHHTFPFAPVSHKSIFHVNLTLQLAIWYWNYILLLLDLGVLVPIRTLWKTHCWEMETLVHLMLLALILHPLDQPAF